MFAVNLKQIIKCNSFRLIKNACYNEFRGNLLEESLRRNTSLRCFASNILENTNRKSCILHIVSKPNIVPKRQVTSGGASKTPKTPIKWKTVGIVAVFATAFLVYFRYLKEKKLERIEALRNKEIGKAKLGGKFTLIDQDNKPVSSDDLIGDWLLIYFGFTHCPDICPEELEKMVDVIDRVEKNKDIKNVKPVFITVDPLRDSPSVIKKYLREFSDKIIGLTGTEEQIAQACKAYRVYFSPGPKDSDADYIVDHSIIMYLVDPQGNFIDFYGQNKNAQQITDSIHFNQVKQENLNKSSLSKLLNIF